VYNDSSAMRKIRGFKNFLILPINDSPERELSKFLNNLSDTSPYWNQIYSGYSHQFAFKDITVEEIYNDRKKAKNWFQNQKQYWGSGCAKIINLWIKENQSDVDKFVELFDAKIFEYRKVLGE
jgi:hypothetical protein